MVFTKPGKNTRNRRFRGLAVGARCGDARLGSSGGAGADCALGSREWAEPPQYLPAMCWGVLRNGSQHTLECVDHEHFVKQVDDDQPW